MNIEVYTDGSATTNDKPGGYAFVVVIDGIKYHEGSGYMPNASNNDAELEAAIQGLIYLKENYVKLLFLPGKEPPPGQYPKNAKITLVSDSQLILGWASGRYTFRQVDKMEKFKRLQLLVHEFDVQTRWVEGHNGDEHNERCDKLANEARLQKQVDIRSKKWTESEELFLLNNYDKMTVEEIACKLKRTIPSVSMHLSYKEIRKNKTFVPIEIGEIYGILTVVGINGDYLSGHTRYDCKCNCGNLITTRGDALAAGKAKSCGCSRIKLSEGELSKNFIFSTYKSRAKKKKLEFSLTKSYFLQLISENCHYCNAPPKSYNCLKNRVGITEKLIRRSATSANGIDRKSSKLGYTIENSLPCCATCNFLKSDLEYNEFIQIVMNIYNFRCNKE
jgi:ribonuclease HI